MRQIIKNNSAINDEVMTNHLAYSDCQRDFLRMIEVPSQQTTNGKFNAHWFDTQLGPMMAIADDDGLYLLEFFDCRGIHREVELLRTQFNVELIPEQTPIIKNIQTEISHFCSRKISEFKTPIHLTGTPFQQSVWKELLKIPFGETRSYLEIAKSLNKPSAFRAVAQANAANILPLVVPCHRVINSNGELGGYNGGIARKRWLLQLEKKRQ